MTVQEKDAAAGQVSRGAAEIYEDVFVPALFGQFGPMLAEAAGIRAGMQVLDVATGTGVAARAAAARGAAVTATDINEGMLAVARPLAPGVAFRRADAEALPFPDEAFDAVTCQFGLMFFGDRAAALREMARVTRPGGHVAVAVFDSWPKSPGYCDLIPLVGEIVGPAGAEALKAPFCLGDRTRIAALFAAAGLHDPQITLRTGEVRHPSMAAWLDTEIGGWTLAEMVDDGMMDRLRSAAPEPLGHYLNADGSVSFATRAIFAVARARKDQ
ncbi:class I SAM-dependent methyltransferase [Mangrovicoccus sp. HB161399]|uniref:class I SAM-dependent methyltransferase n=1 Tax=Mangrovicoccus sp. HB161399 TaxID=2720392 RepID=UPI001557503B|nr:methyltransferase domain-containing protein [Mangrovicoccus sp. HB161399]